MDVTICKENEIRKKSSQIALQALKLFLIILRETYKLEIERKEKHHLNFYILPNRT